MAKFKKISKNHYEHSVTGSTLKIKSTGVYYRGKKIAENHDKDLGKGNTASWARDWMKRRTS